MPGVSGSHAPTPSRVAPGVTTVCVSPTGRR